MESKLISAKDAAKYLGLKKGTLAIWRANGKGPKFYRIGKSIRYKYEDLDAFIVPDRETP